MFFISPLISSWNSSQRKGNRLGRPGIDFPALQRARLMVLDLRSYFLMVERERSSRLPSWGCGFFPNTSYKLPRDPQIASVPEPVCHWWRSRHLERPGSWHRACSQSFCSHFTGGKESIWRDLMDGPLIRTPFCKGAPSKYHHFGNEVSACEYSVNIGVDAPTFSTAPLTVFSVCPNYLRVW